MEWRDPKTGTTLNRSTKYRRDSVEHSRKARQLCAQRTADELEAPAARGESWQWVHNWLSVSFADKTLIRYRQAFFAFGVFMQERQITAPRQLQREDAEQYLAWRMKPPKESGVRTACKNTAILDLRVISRIMREAVLRHLAPANPFLQLGFKKDPVEPTPDILPHELPIIERGLAKVRDEAMQISWKISMIYARRISETSIPLTDIDLVLGTITFRNKGGKFKTKLLHHELRPLVKQWKAEGRARTFEMPPNFSKKWSKFFDKIGLPHITFHSTRVRVATKLMEKGVHPEIARDYIDHSSELVHRIYLRSRPAHQQAAIDAVASAQSDADDNKK